MSLEKLEDGAEKAAIPLMLYSSIAKFLPLYVFYLHQKITKKMFKKRLVVCRFDTRKKKGPRE